MAAGKERGFVDGPGARLVALGVILAASAALAYLHRDTLFPPDATQQTAGNPQLAACLAQRIGAVDKMKAEGVVSDAQYGAFRARAEAFCLQQFGQKAGPPGAPGGAGLPPLGR